MTEYTHRHEREKEGNISSIDLNVPFFLLLLLLYSSSPPSYPFPSSLNIIYMSV